MRINQFDIWQVNLNPTKGSEQRGHWPCIVLQTNAVGDYGLTTVIAPLTSKKVDRIYAFEVEINPNKINGLRDVSKIKFDQLRVIDKGRLIKKRGKIERKYHADILNALKIIFDLGGDFRD